MCKGQNLRSKRRKHTALHIWRHLFACFLVVDMIMLKHDRVEPSRAKWGKKLEDFRSKSLIFFEEEFSCLWWKFYLDFRHIILRLSRSISREILTKQLQQRQLSEILRQLWESFFVLRQNERYAKTKRSLFETIKNKTKQKNRSKTIRNNLIANDPCIL